MSVYELIEQAPPTAGYVGSLVLEQLLRVGHICKVR